MAAVGGKSFDGGDFLAGDAGNRGDAGARSFAIDMHGASAAERHAAAEFRAGHVQGVTKHPEQRHVRADFDGLGLAVQSESDGHGNLPPADEYPTTNPGKDENLRKLIHVARKSAARIGSRRMRLPVAAKMAFPRAAAMGGTPGSPQPPGGSVLGTM